MPSLRADVSLRPVFSSFQASSRCRASLAAAAALILVSRPRSRIWPPSCALCPLTAPSPPWHGTSRRGSPTKRVSPCVFVLLSPHSCCCRFCGAGSFAVRAAGVAVPRFVRRAQQPRRHPPPLTQGASLCCSSARRLMPVVSFLVVCSLRRLCRASRRWCRRLRRWSVRTSRLSTTTPCSYSHSTSTVCSLRVCWLAALLPSWLCVVVFRTVCVIG